jgi:hypothetical protein
MGSLQPNLLVLPAQGENAESPYVIQIMFGAKIGQLSTRLYVREITNRCDGGLNAVPSH